ncbi:MAG: thermonuclease family protein [Firmicutes bacterium]|nr:thermonuclease family protein [Bacillota bacterium]
MKKILLLILTFFISINICYAEERIEVTFNSCIDGDTANVILNDSEIKIRFLAIDTPETKHPTKGEESFGKEASEYTCNRLMNAKKVEIEYESNSDKLDKYNRHLVWVWVDDYLLQDEIIKEGLAEVAYLYGDYKYTSILEDHQSIAKVNKVGIWQEQAKENNNTRNYFMIGLIIGSAIILTFTGNLNKSKIKKIKKGLKKYGS